MRIKNKDIPELRAKIAEMQMGLCKLCGIELSKTKACLDHDHKTGRIRGVLCLNCNGIEGKIHNLARRAKREESVEKFMTSILDYWAYFKVLPRSEIHPTFKTEDEKRILRNKKARLRRIKKKSS